MPQRPYVSFQEVKRRISLLEVLEVFGIAGQFRKNGATISGVCPLPRHKHGPSPNSEQFKINLKGDLYLWHCFGDCQIGGDVVEFVKEMTGYDNSHVRFWFAEKFPDRLALRKERRGDQDPVATSEETPSTEKARANTGKDKAQRADSEESTAIVSDSNPPLKPLRFRLNLDPEVPYLRHRGLTMETIRRFGLGLCTKGLLAGYVAIPVYGYPRPIGSNPVGYLGRWPGEDHDAIGEESRQPRYKFPQDFPRNRVIYGLAEALDGTEGEPLIVVEGAFKLFHLVQNGFSATVATFGASVSDEQAEILSSTCRPIIFMFDGDEAGRNGMRSAAGKLITRTFVRVIKLSDGCEPDSLSATDLQKLLR